MALFVAGVAGAWAALTPLRAQAPVTPRPASARPALVVLLVVDQFRADYVDRYGAQWSHGLRRLLTTGAYFDQAAYPYSATETCPGHATIATGAWPRTHGYIANGWYDRAAGRPILCTNDGSSPVAFGRGQAFEQHGPALLRIPTFADELRAQQPGGADVISLSLKARSAIAMAGHGGGTVAWLEDAGAWSTSSAYAGTAPSRADAFTRAHPVEDDYARRWDPLLQAARYVFTDDGLAEQAPDGWTTRFPHTLSRPEGPDRIFFDNWRRTPFGDEYLGRMAAAMAGGLTRPSGTDVLAVSFSAVDYVGHKFGPSSVEIQDTLVRLDATIGHLLDALDASVGTGRYVVALTGDHGVAPIPEQQVAAGLDAGRVISADALARVDAVLTAALGAGRHVMPLSDDANNKATDLYFTSQVNAALASNPKLRQAVAEAAESAPAIARAVWPAELAASTDPLLRATALNYRPDRSGDLLLVATPYWVAESGGTGHGTPYAYDQRVPIVLMGASIKPGRYRASVTPADIAPTLARLTGITLPNADGRVLSEVLR